MKLRAQTARHEKRVPLYKTTKGASSVRGRGLLRDSSLDVWWRQEQDGSRSCACLGTHTTTQINGSNRDFRLCVQDSCVVWTDDLRGQRNLPNCQFDNKISIISSKEHSPKPMKEQSEMAEGSACKPKRPRPTSTHNPPSNSSR